ncbi:helix-turn-helix domain-containing protein [Occultella gossypii]|uniref:Helix-turn-helix transcriptional regulator n=1 Tax=Occultella gossypii TaxID=2800820 RepID=A0ABS7SA65_9MICO|nr:helix-turn-helix transcriptional regulator [Occultella gossypii]MBZ2197239.1 helix-turn-helix transcriptional regulator [Occultella gossypii]
MNEYGPSPAAQVITAARKRAGLSVRAVARDAGISEGRWRQIEKGYQQVTTDVRAPVNAPAQTLARMANATAVPVAQLQAVGATEVAEALAEMREPIQMADGPMFGGSYDEPDYLRRVEGFLQELQYRLASVEATVEQMQNEREDGEEHDVRSPPNNQAAVSAADDYADDEDGPNSEAMPQTPAEATSPETLRRRRR